MRHSTLFLLGGSKSRKVSDGMLGGAAFNFLFFFPFLSFSFFSFPSFFAFFFLFPSTPQKALLLGLGMPNADRTSEAAKSKVGNGWAPPLLLLLACSLLLLGGGGR